MSGDESRARVALAALRAAADPPRRPTLASSVRPPRTALPPESSRAADDWALLLRSSEALHDAAAMAAVAATLPAPPAAHKAFGHLADLKGQLPAAFAPPPGPPPPRALLVLAALLPRYYGKGAWKDDEVGAQNVLHFWRTKADLLAPPGSSAASSREPPVAQARALVEVVRRARWSRKQVTRFVELLCAALTLTPAESATAPADAPEPELAGGAPRRGGTA